MAARQENIQFVLVCCSQERSKGTEFIGVHPTSLLYSFIHVSQAVWSGACIIKIQSVQLSLCTLSFSLVLKEDCAASHFILFLDLWRRLFITSLLHQTSLFHSIKPILSLSLQAWWVLIAKYGDLWTAKCMLRYVRFFNIFLSQILCISDWS